MKRATASICVALLAGATTALVAACGASGAAAPVLADAKRSLPEGAKVYERECQGCHGANGEGLSGNPAVMGGGALPEHRRQKASLSNSPDQPGRVSAGAINPQDERAPFKTAKDVYDYVSTQMPLPTPGMSPKDAWAVTSYMLAGHGVKVPAGGLTEANAASVIVNP